MRNDMNYPEYAGEYENAKKKRKRTKLIGRLISLGFFPWFFGAMLLSEGSHPGLGTALGALLILFYFSYWSFGTVARFVMKNKQESEIRRTFLRKCAYEEGYLGCEEFYYNAEQGLPDDTLYGSGLLFNGTNQFPNLIRNLAPFTKDVNNEYMAGVCKGIPFERATVDLQPGAGMNFEVNWMVFDLPFNTKTSLRYMSGMFAQRSLGEGCLGTPFYTVEGGYGGMYHIAGEEPPEALRDAVLELAGNIGDDCEILVFGNRLHVLLKRRGFVSNLPEKTNQLSEEQIRQQIAGRIYELSQCAETVRGSFIGTANTTAEATAPQGTQYTMTH